MKKIKKTLLVAITICSTLSVFATGVCATTDEKQSSGNTALDEFLKTHKTEESDFKLNFDGTDTSNFKPDATTQPVQANLQEGWNVEGDNPDKICKVVNGEKVKGWYNGATRWYYFNEDGTMARSKWINTGNNWYYVGAEGQMLREAFVDGHWIDVNGLASADGDKFSLGAGIFAPNGNKKETITVYDSSTGKSNTLAEDDAKVLSSQGKLGVRVERGSTQWTDNSNNLKWFTK